MSWLQGGCVAGRGCVVLLVNCSAVLEQYKRVPWSTSEPGWSQDHPDPPPGLPMTCPLGLQ
jgi:hypothetical protein